MKKILTLICLFITLSMTAQRYRLPHQSWIPDSRIVVDPLITSRQEVDTIIAPWAAAGTVALYPISDGITNTGYLSGTDNLYGYYLPGDSGNMIMQNAQIFFANTKITVLGAKYTFGAVHVGPGDTPSVILFDLYKLDNSYVDYEGVVVPGPGTLVSQVVVPVRDLKVLKQGVDNVASGSMNIIFPTPLTVDADSGYAIGFDISQVSPLDTIGLLTSYIGGAIVPERSILVNSLFNPPPPLVWNSFLDTLGWGVSVDLAIFPIVNLTLYDTISVSLCKNSSYNGMIVSYPGTFTDTLVNGSSLGFDSIVTLNLSILFPDTSSAQVSGNTLTADQIGVQYEWINCGTGQVQAGATGQTFIAPQSGGYQLVVSDNGCLDTSICYDIVAGITEVQDFDFSMQPNPAKDICTLYPGTIKGGNWSAGIFNMEGQLVRSLFINEQSIQSYSFSTEALPAGLYLLKVTDDSGATGIKKLMIE